MEGYEWIYNELFDKWEYRYVRSDHIYIRCGHTYSAIVYTEYNVPIDEDGNTVRRQVCDV